MEETTCCDCFSLWKSGVDGCRQGPQPLPGLSFHRVRERVRRLGPVPREHGEAGVHGDPSDTHQVPELQIFRVEQGT